MIKDGIHYGISPKDYHAWEFNKEDPAKGPISTSLFKAWLNDGPLKFRHAAKRESSAAMSWGSLVDCLAFTPQHFEQDFVLKEDCPHLSAGGAVRSSAAKEWMMDQAEQGKNVVGRDQWETALTAVARLKQTPASGEILEKGHYQVAMVYTPQDGIPTKGLIDVLPQHLDHDDCIADLKTTSVNLYRDGDLSRQVAQYGYHIQAALYLFLWSKLSDDTRRRWKIIWQSSAPPYEVRVTELTDEWLDAGRAVIMKCLPIMVKHFHKKHFPSPFSNRETVLPMHSAALYAIEDQVELITSLDS